jgi:hypothetical protein
VVTDEGAAFDETNRQTARSNPLRESKRCGQNQSNVVHALRGDCAKDRDGSQNPLPHGVQATRLQELQFVPRAWRKLSREGKAEKGATRRHNMFEVWLANPHPVKQKKGENES